MNRIKSLLIALVASAILAACASMTGVALAPFTKANDGVLAGNNNMTLYIYTKDVAASKVDQVQDAAHQAGHPLQALLEPVE